MNILGGEVGLELLLRLGAVSGLAVFVSLGLRRAPETWHRAWLPDLAFAAGLVIQLAILAERSLRMVELDIDSMQHATALLDAHTLGEAIDVRRGAWAADYILQSPLVHVLRRILPIDPIGAYRLLTFVGAAATALLLRYGARGLGAGPWASALAGLLPLYTFGPAWLIVSLDDNAAASALEWAFVFALLRGLVAPDEGEKRLRAMLCAGLLLGLSISFHRKAFLWAALLPIAPLVSRHFRSARALRGLAAAGVAAAAIHVLAAALFLPGGLDVDSVARLIQSPHHQNPSWWLPASGLGLVAQPAAVWDGLRSTLIVFPLVSELLMGQSSFYLVDAVVPLCVAAAIVAIWMTRGDRFCRLLAVGLAAQCAHSLLYEPRSIERWDTVLAGCGVLAAVSVSKRHRTSGAWCLGTAWLWLLLATAQYLGTGLYADAADVAGRLRPEITGQGTAREQGGEAQESLQDSASGTTR